jgi:hypothetical protein
MILFIGVVLTACCTTQIGAEVAKHAQLALQYAQSGEKAEAEAEREKLVKAFEASLDANSSDSSGYINASCTALLQNHIDGLKTENANSEAFRTAIGTSFNPQRDADKVCPLADKQRQAEIGLLFTEITIIHKNCGGSDFVQQVKQAIAAKMELAGLSAFYCKDGVAYVMPMKNPPPLPGPKPALQYPVPQNLFPTPLPAPPAPSAQ